MAWMKGVYGNYGRKVFGVDNRGVEFRNADMDTKDTTGGSRILSLVGYLTGTAECTQGGLNVTLTRSASFPLTTGWGGAEDTAARIMVYNSAANSTTYGGQRALHVYVRQYSGGQICNMQGGMFSLDDRGSGGSDGCSLVNGYALLATCRPNGVVKSTGTFHSLIVEDTGQGTVSPTNYNNSLLHIRTAGGVSRASGAVPCAISFEKGASSSGMAATFGFKSTDGGEGLTAYAGTITGSGNMVRITVNVNGTSYYILGYATVDH